MEWLQLFNENEEVLDKKILRGENPTNNEYIMVVYLFIINSDNKILLEKNYEKDIWVVPGGHVDTPNILDNLKRESMEELSLDISNCNIINIDTLRNDNRIFKIFLINKDIDINSLVLQKEEVKEVKYFTIDEIDTMINNGTFRSNNIKFIDSLKKYLHI